MFKTWLICLLLSSLLISKVNADELNVDDIKHKLLSTERSAGLSANPTDTKHALLQKDLEVKRADYARAIELVSEGIESQKQLEKSRADYEECLIQAASGKTPIKTVMNAINKMRQSISHWRDEQLAATKSSNQL